MRYNAAMTEVQHAPCASAFVSVSAGTGGTTVQHVPPALEIRHVYMKSGRVCTNFIRIVKKEFEMYTARVGWRPAASVSVDWSPVCGRIREEICGLP